MEAFHVDFEVPPIGKIPVFVRRWGCGPKVLLVHGWMNTSQRWHTLALSLASQYEVWALDLPGFGQTPPVPLCYATLEIYSEIVAKLIERIYEGEVLHGLVGHSMGGILSLLLLKQPNLAMNRIIASGTPVTGVHYMKFLANHPRVVATCLRITQRLPTALRKLTAKRLNFGSRRLGDTAKTNPKNPREVHAPTAATLLKQICNCNLFSDLQPLLSGTSEHVLIMRGQHDPFNSHDDSVQLAQVLGGIFHEFRGARHSPLLEQPEKSYPILRQFLEHGN